ncbi:hypothetical protein M407DRAFT_246284, partial [Tulasnella calospora MUT 4182]
MPGFTFHPQPGAGTPPGMMPHFLSPGVGPNSPPHFTGHLGRQGSFHAAPGGGPQHPHSSMQAALAMMYGTPPMIHTPPVHPHHHHAAHQYMMLTPGPRLDAAVAAGSPVSVNGGAYPLSPGHPMQMQAWSPPVPPGGEGMATPYAAVEGQRDYFVAAASAGQEEPTGYFPPVAPTTSSSSGGGGGSIGPSDVSASMSAEDSRSTGAPSSAPVLQDAAVIVDSSSSGSTESPFRKPPGSDPAATIRARVAGMTLDEKTVPSMVNEIAVASGLGMGTAKKAMVVAAAASAAGGGGSSAQNGKLPSLWMSQKGRFNRSNAASPLSGSSPEQEAVASFNSAAMGRNASGPLPKLNEKDVRRPMMGMPGLPSPGRRASWAAEPGSRRPEVV